MQLPVILIALTYKDGVRRPIHPDERDVKAEREVLPVPLLVRDDLCGEPALHRRGAVRRLRVTVVLRFQV